MKAKQDLSLSTWMAILIAVCSLVLSLWSGLEDRRYKRLSVRPQMQISFYYTKDQGAGWYLWNSGLGPARIKWFEVTVDGQPKKNWQEVALSLKSINTVKKIRYHQLVPAPESLVKSGNSERIFWFDEEPLVEIVKQNSGRINMKICYCSLYDECWQTSTEGGATIGSSCKELPTVSFGSDPIPKAEGSPTAKGQ